MEDRDFRDELLAQDRIGPELQAELARRVVNMLERDLRPVEKVMCWFAAIMGVGFFLGFGYAFVWSLRIGLPWEAGAGFAMGSLFGLGWAAMAYSILRKGKMIRDRHPIQMTGLIWAFALLLFILFSMLAPELKNHYAGTLMVLNALGYLVIGVMWVITTRIDQAGLKSEEQFLKLQLQLEDVSIRLQRLEEG